MLGVEAEAAQAIQESCNLRDVLTASETMQQDGFREMITGLASVKDDEILRMFRPV